ncbi:sugar kinase [Kytococcus sedentarius]|uniref:Sugar kinase, ribokinase n=1 Tax=Kytococcus sedentarius (strain ATCC 14392 / DSM 20547 / JCM 11482 / CCUG 33030 / NBRC 15357 / NCTC 11040 / CCM 314 / 541) TaxID=478801 RepID=C7NFD9_KYTSD|nr:PfkB family carbohydrate kinase [Kytococcus sedentarius]ACV05874.1 sugar kinase, ribokinase [Kytococcus sedentarius DSM 20547]QQB64269.1 sugar kinase [Kytococcus sedentarius]STX12710.1 Ribokinase [Kytococcus sedentarius]
MQSVQQPRIIHTAQALVDEVFHVPALPELGGNVMACSAAQYAGGAVTTLVAARRQGAQAVHAGSIGTGWRGDLVREALAAAGVVASAPTVEDADTGTCVVLVDNEAERTFITTQGAERVITAASLATAAPVPGDVVCVSGYTLLDPTRQPLLDFLAALPEGVDVCVDPGAVFAGLAERDRRAVVAATTQWTSNLAEARALTGEHHPSMGGAAAAVAAHLIDASAPVEAVVVRDGEKGCAVVAVEGGRAGEPVDVPGFPQEAVDTNGAGDTHCGAMVAERLRGVDWVTACRRGNAASAITVTRPGPDTAPDRAETDAFLDAQE